MFKNVGRKIQIAGIVLFFVFTILGIVLGIVLVNGSGARWDGFFAFGEDDFWGNGGELILLALVGPIVGYVTALVMHGFGTIVSAFESNHAAKELPKE